MQPARRQARRLATGVLALAALAVAPAVAHSAPAVGIGDQFPRMFADPRWQALGIRDGRYVAAWNALHSRRDRADLDNYLTVARAAGVRVLVSLGHARGRIAAHRIPTVARYAREFRAFRARYPWITDWEVWNEANMCHRRGCTPERFARFYNAARRSCLRCRIVGADLVDLRSAGAWARRFRRVAKGPLIWGLHNYIDVNRFTTLGTRALLDATRGRVWFTETGGLVRRTNHSSIRFGQGLQHALKATRWVFRLAALSRRVRRVYLYQWMPAPDPHASWDSALLDRRGRPRPALAILQSWLFAHSPRY